MQLLPYSSLVPLLQASPTGNSTSATHLLWEHLPQGMPPHFSTKTMPVRVARSSTRGLPPSGLGGSSGKSGSTISQCSSVTNSLAIFSAYPDSAVLKESLSRPGGLPLLDRPGATFARTCKGGAVGQDPPLASSKPLPSSLLPQDPLSFARADPGRILAMGLPGTDVGLGYARRAAVNVVCDEGRVVGRVEGIGTLLAV